MTKSEKAEKSDATDTAAKPEIIGTDRLAELVSERTGRNISPKRLRSVLRGDQELGQAFDDGHYTRYQFEFPSKTVDRILERFDQIETERAARTAAAEKRKTERSKREKTVIELTDSGVTTKTVE